jgi:hypothetical protein
MFELGKTATKDEEIDSGTSDHETMTTLGDDDSQTTYVDGKFSTNEAGMTTGLDHEAGTTISDYTETTLLLGTTVIKYEGTFLGTTVYETIATEGELDKTITYDEGNFETHETGKATGLDHEFGTTIADGASTKDEIATYTIAVAGTDSIKPAGTFVGIFSQATMTYEGSDEISMT